MRARSRLIVGIAFVILLCLISALVPGSWGPVGQRLGTAKLVGVPEPVPFPLAATSAREFQQTAERWFAEQVGWPREFVIRLNNGLAYVLGRSSNSVLELGKERWVFGRSLKTEWCERPLVDASYQVEKFAALQKAVRDRGKVFVLVISPSKRAIYSDMLFDYCRPPPRARTYEILVPALRAAGLVLVDGHEISAGLRKSQPLPVFGRDRIHWNDLPSVAVADQLFRAMEPQMGRSLPRIEPERIPVDNTPLFDENDLAQILNLPFDLHPVSPHALMKVVDASRFRPKVFIVGGSFSQPLLRVLGRSGAAARTDYAFYYSRLGEFSGGQLVNLGPSFAAAASVPHVFEEADAVIVEANEETLDGDYVDKFLEDVEALD